MTSKLKQYFPLLKSRTEVLEEINSRPELEDLFSRWGERRQEEFLDFVTGVRGVKLLYDGFFKEVMNPETVPERLNELLSLLLGRKVQIMEVLPNDNSRFGDDSALVIMDIVVKLEDGSICNVEVQKIGYRFPGERAACYAADLLLRQYKAARAKKTGKSFSYRDIKGVYTIVFMEKSSQEFQMLPDCYLHHSRQIFDTGLKMNLLEEFLFVPLDIALEKLHNKGITNKLDAWLMFLASDAPEDVIAVIDCYPEFKELYAHTYRICEDIEEVMRMFSEELRILDKNTERLMIDEMQDEIKALGAEVREKTRALTEMDEAIAAKNEAIAAKDEAITAKEKAIAAKDEALAKKDEELEKLRKALAELQEQQALKK